VAEEVAEANARSLKLEDAFGKMGGITALGASAGK